MSKIAILTDSSCDIPQELAEKYGIDIMSFHILLDDVDYIERESCTNEEFYEKMRAAKGIPSTAAITPIQFCEKYCQYVDEGYTDVIHVPINRSGSSTYNNAVMAQGMLREERPEHHLRIHLLDPHLWLVCLRDGTQAAEWCGNQPRHPGVRDPDGQDGDRSRTLQPEADEEERPHLCRRRCHGRADGHPPHHHPD